jgi:hypothetical protein
VEHEGEEGNLSPGGHFLRCRTPSCGEEETSYFGGKLGNEFWTLDQIYEHIQQKILSRQLAVSLKIKRSGLEI